MNRVHSKSLHLALVTAFAAVGLTASALAHEGHEAHTPNDAPLPGGTVLQLDAVRNATARFHDVAQAEAEGYVDIGLFFPNMGWHYMNWELLANGKFEAESPELLVYADDPCGGPRRLVAVEYAVPLALSKNAPEGFVGKADVWSVFNNELWTLHAWVHEYNPDGVFAANNPRVLP
jgi:hypothetical protein